MEISEIREIIKKAPGKTEVIIFDRDSKEIHDIDFISWIGDRLMITVNWDWNQKAAVPDEQKHDEQIINEIRKLLEE